MERDNTKVENVMEKNKKVREWDKRRYYFSPNYCEACGVMLPYELRHYNTCSLECTKRLEAKLMWEGDYF